jgi:hypothetical protein
MKKLFAFAFAVAFALGATGTARADMTPDVAAALDKLQKQMDAVKAQMEILRAQKAAPAPAPVQPAGSFITKVPGEAQTFLIGGEPVTFYGNLDLSLDYTTKGLQKFYPGPGDAPMGNMSWLPQLSTNLSYIGVRGRHKLGPKSALVYQLETQLDITATAGTVNNNASNDSIVKGALTSRNSYVGLDTNIGAFKIGKTDAPYKTATARMNPFNGHINDYAIVMGNTGGDNRVEFGTRIDHALWYESKNFFGGWTVNALVAPGQNRSFISDGIAAGESSCAGGNVPGSGALPPACNDGSWSHVMSVSANYNHANLYLTGAYEIHKRVNRSSDIGDPALAALDIGDEHAVKGGFQWGLNKRTTLSGLYEVMTRDVPLAIQYQNERTRNGFWWALTHQFDSKNVVNFGWARANPSVGDPGQHNTAAGLNPDNMSNMLAFMYRHSIDRHVSWYFDYVDTLNHYGAHYDIGAGGRGLTTDCHDASLITAFDATVTPTPVSGVGPHCYTGGHIQGFSGGINVRF